MLVTSSAVHETGRGGRASGVAVLIAAALGLAASGCDQGAGQAARDDASGAAHQAASDLNRTAVATRDTVDDLAAAAKPGVQRAGQDARQGLDKLAVAAGKAAVKAGSTLETAGRRASVRDNATDSGQGD